tara:strand:+ start:410 stop:718 length:309 start_codon:yes stop_codon:yes gene_type:complete
MADFGEFGGPIKDYLGSQSITAETGGTDTTITHEITTGSTRSMTCLITTNGNCFIEINASATTDSFPLTSSDTMVIKINGGATLGARGNGGSRTVTVKKYVS